MKMILDPPDNTTVEATIILYKTVFDLLLDYGEEIYALVEALYPKTERCKVSSFDFSHLKIVSVCFHF